MSGKDLVAATARGSGIVFLILGGVFALVGLPFLIIGAFPVFDYLQSASWQHVPAIVEHVELAEEQGEETSLFHVKGAYRYDWASQTYHSSRITLSDTSTSDRNSWLPLYERLDKSRQAGTPIQVLVDPASPSNALATRELTPGLLIFPALGGFFFVSGLLFVAVGLWSLLQRTGPADPSRPWIGDGPWEGFQVRSSGIFEVVIAWVIAVAFGIFESVFVFAFIAEPGLPLIVKGMLGIFLLLAAALLIRAVYITLRHLKYGDSLLVLSQIPLVPGGTFDGVVITRRPLRPEDGCKATVRCIAIVRKVRTSGSNTKTTYTEEIRYEKPLVVRADLAQEPSGRSAIPVKIEIPGHLPPRFLQDYPQIRWKLAIEAETAGIDFSAEFELPVYGAVEPSLIQYREQST
ncbi:MAG TPA: DUF3592 domain-containing protein [Candidatus Ozemobacteraceae bacterium]|nr:DUF3592 domain-containing protein [Candidatus Ozemobacteraceae bacterium]